MKNSINKSYSEMTYGDYIHDMGVLSVLQGIIEDLVEDEEVGIDGWTDIWWLFWSVSKRRRLSFDWYDPDTSYKEDIMYFYRAFEEELKRLGEDLKVQVFL